MPHYISIIDPEEEKLRSKRRRFLFLYTVVFFALLYMPSHQEMKIHWKSHRLLRKTAEILQKKKSEAILKRQPVELRFNAQGFIEVFQVSDCGISNIKAELKERINLSQIVPDLTAVIIGPQEVRSVFPEGEVTSLSRFCYDPLQGSSLPIDGVIHGSIFMKIQESEKKIPPTYGFIEIVGNDGVLNIQRI